MQADQPATNMHAQAVTACPDAARLCKSWVYDWVMLFAEKSAG